MRDRRDTEEAAHVEQISDNHDPWQKLAKDQINRDLQSDGALRGLNSAKLNPSLYAAGIL